MLESYILHATRDLFPGFSPLAGKLMLESWYEKNEFEKGTLGFSPLAGKLMLESPFMFYKRNDGTSYLFQSPCGEINVGKQMAKVAKGVAKLVKFQSPCGEINVGKAPMFPPTPSFFNVSVPLRGN